MANGDQVLRERVPPLNLEKLRQIPRESSRPLHVASATRTTLSP